MIKVRLFWKIALIMLISLWTTNMITLVISAEIMEKIFIESFTETNNQILDQLTLSFEKLNEQNISVIDTCRQNVALKQYLTTTVEDEKELFKSFYQIKQNLKGIELMRNFEECDVVVLGNNEKIYNVSGRKLTITPEALNKHPITQKSKAHPSKLIYSYSNKGLNLIPDNPNIIAVKQLLDPYTAHSFGTLYIQFDEETISHMYADFVGTGNTMMMVNQEGIIVSSNVKGLVGKLNKNLLAYAEEIQANDYEYLIEKAGKEKNIILAKYLPVYDMYLMNQVNINSALGSFNEMKPVIFMVCFMVTCVAMIGVFAITRKITTPLTQLITEMKATKNGTFVKSNHVGGSYEIRELQEVYNKMIDELDIYIDSLIEAQKQRRKAELEALQMQINPHFLYNTLATIKYLSWQGDGEALTRTINALIDLLQNTISKTDEQITIAEEIKNLKNYVTINQARYGNRIQVAYYVEEECEGDKLPKLILQPFLENAFFHAYQEKKEGTIRVFIERVKEMLICEIVDDGDGIAQENVQANKQYFTGIGIKNVDERIKLLYGNEYGVQITSEKGRGTTVKIKLPKSKKTT